jgi:mannose-6-phosphate isomerase-like protein (cupin superfamily)
MRLGEEVFSVEPGDSVLIPPDTPHCIEASGEAPLHILCCCSQAYAHADTELLEG